MRYLGGKSRIAPAIHELIRAKAPTADCVTDLFAGSLAFSSYMKQAGFAVTTNDILFFSYALSRGSVALNTRPDFAALEAHIGREPLQYLMQAQIPSPDPSDFVRLNYSPDSVPARMYLTTSNAARIDFCRRSLNSWRTTQLLTDDGYFYLLACVIAALPFVSNTTGTYSSFLKYWDSRALKDLPLQETALFDNARTNTALNMDAHLALGSLTGQVLYLDPPYNARQYLPNYHVLETVARYDNPPVRGVTGQRPGKDIRSPFCSKSTALPALVDLLAAANFEHIVLSYNTEGVISPDELEQTLRAAGCKGSFHKQVIPYRRYKSKVPNSTPGLSELVYYIRKF